MGRCLRACIALFCLSVGIAPLWAQAGEQGAGPDKQSVIDGSDPQARPAFESAFTGYRAFDAYPEAADWRAANDEVGRLGGAMGHMRSMDDTSPEPLERTR